MSNVVDTMRTTRKKVSHPPHIFSPSSALFKHLDTMQSLSKEVDSSLQESEFKPWIVDWTKWEIPGGWPVEKVPDVPSKIDEQPEDWLKGAPEWFLEAEEVLKTDERLRACGHSVCECEREKRPSESHQS